MPALCKVSGKGYVCSLCKVSYIEGALCKVSGKGYDCSM